MPLDRRIRATFVAALLLLAAAARPGTKDDGDALGIALAESHAVARAAAAVRPSVVALRALGTGRDSYGTGIIVGAEGLVLTALHVVDGATAIAVVAADGGEFPGKVVASDPGVDLALLEIVGADRAFVPATLAPDHATDVGETIVAVSNPFGLGISVSRGIVSALDRRNVIENYRGPLLQTDAAINPGSSGGALVNLHGEVVGLITAILTRSGGNQGVGFALPSHELRRAIGCLRRGESVPRPWLGVRVLKDAVQEGLKVLRVAPDGPAAEAGVRDGDVLRSLRGRPLEGLEDLRAVLAESEVGEDLAAEIARDGRVLTLSIRVASKP